MLKVIKKDGTDAEYIEGIDKLAQKVVRETEPGPTIAEKIISGLKTKYSEEP